MWIICIFADMRMPNFAPIDKIIATIIMMTTNMIVTKIKTIRFIIFMMPTLGLAPMPVLVSTQTGYNNDVFMMFI